MCPLLTYVGPSRDLWNVNNAASVQLCAAFLILPGVWGENGGSFHHIYPHFGRSRAAAEPFPLGGLLKAFARRELQSGFELFSSLLSHGKLRLDSFLGKGSGGGGAAAGTSGSCFHDW